jgi:hypothetical protein
MITKNYKPPTDALVCRIPEVKDRKGKLVSPSRVVIRCTPAYLKALKITATADQEFLQSQLEGHSICPPLLMFKDSERARKLLRAKEEKR